MLRKNTRDFLIRNVPIESDDKVALSRGLEVAEHPVGKPTPFTWRKKLTRSFVRKAIQEGRE